MLLATRRGYAELLRSSPFFVSFYLLRLDSRRSLSRILLRDGNDRKEYFLNKEKWISVKFFAKVAVKAKVAQLVEHRFRKAGVVSSILTFGSNNRGS